MHGLVPDNFPSRIAVAYSVDGSACVLRLSCHLSQLAQAWNINRLPASAYYGRTRIRLIAKDRSTTVARDIYL